MNKSFVKFVTDFGPLAIFLYIYYSSGKDIKVALVPFIIATIVALLIVFSLILLEKFSRRKTKRWSDNPASLDSQGWVLKKHRAFFAIIVSLFPPTFAIGIPFFWVLLNFDQLNKGLSTCSKAQYLPPF